MTRQIRLSIATTARATCLTLVCEGVASRVSVLSFPQI